MKNIDPSTVESFGNEWKRFNQATVSNDELAKNFNDYFEIFPWDIIGEDSIGFDMGCGSGRWAKFVAPKVKYLNCIDPSESIAVAKKNLFKGHKIKTTDLLFKRTNKSGITADQFAPYIGKILKKNKFIDEIILPKELK